MPLSNLDRANYVESINQALDSIRMLKPADFGTVVRDLKKILASTSVGDTPNFDPDFKEDMEGVYESYTMPKESVGLTSDTDYSEYQQIIKDRIQAKINEFTLFSPEQKYQYVKNQEVARVQTKKYQKLIVDGEPKRADHATHMETEQQTLERAQQDFQLSGGVQPTFFNRARLTRNAPIVGIIGLEPRTAWETLLSNLFHPTPGYPLVLCHLLLSNGDMAVGEQNMENQIAIINPNTRTVIRQISQHGDGVNCIMQLPDGNIAVGSAAVFSQIRIINPITGALIRRIPQERRGVTDVSQLQSILERSAVEQLKSKFTGGWLAKREIFGGTPSADDVIDRLQNRLRKKIAEKEINWDQGATYKILSELNKLPVEANTTEVPRTRNWNPFSFSK